MTIILAILIGVVTGTLSGLLGLGGGAILVLLAVTVLHVSQHVAQAVALAAIVLTAATATLKHHRNGFVEWRLGTYIAIGGIIGGAGGAYLANALDGNTLSRIFGIVFAVLGIRLFISSYKKKVEKSDTENKMPSNKEQEIIPNELQN